MRGKRQHRNGCGLWISFQSSRCFDAIDQRQTEVHQYQLWPTCTCDGHRRFTPVDFMHVESVGTKHGAVDDAIVLVVLYQEDASARRGRGHVTNVKFGEGVGNWP